MLNSSDSDNHLPSDESQAQRPGACNFKLAFNFSSGKATPCQIPTYTGISRDNSTCYLSQLSEDIPV